MDLFSRRRNWKDHLFLVVCFLRQNVDVSVGPQSWAVHRQGGSQSPHRLKGCSPSLGLSYIQSGALVAVITGLLAGPLSENKTLGEEPQKRKSLQGGTRPAQKGAWVRESVSGVPDLCKREQRPWRAPALGQANSIKKVKKQNYPLHRFYSGNNLANVGIIHTLFVHWAKLVGYSEVPGFSSWRILL